MTEEKAMSKSTLNHSLIREHSFEPLTIEGKIPDDLRGVIYRTGPGLLERFNQKVPHPFDADGAVTAVKFDQGAYGSSQIIKSKEFLEEEEAQHFLYGTLAPWYSVIRNNLNRKVKSTGNTNILSWNKKLYALMEISKPIEINPHSLETGEVTDFDGQIRESFSAHPHRVEKLKTTFNFGIRGQFIDLYALPDDKEFKYLGAIKAPWEGMIHDFMATEKHLIFFIGPAQLIKWRALLGYGDLSDYFKWKPQLGMQIIVVPLSQIDKPIYLSTDTFWIWHFVNAYEENNEIIVEAIRHDHFGAFAAPSSAGPEQAMPSLHRFKINLMSKKISDESLWKTACEFPSVHPDFAGSKNQYIYLQTFNEDNEIGGGVVKYNCKTNEISRWLAPKDHLGCEPIFVSKNRIESDGYLLQFIKDPIIEKSYVAILDADKLEEGPVAKVWFHEAIPMTFHGVFVKS